MGEGKIEIRDARDGKFLWIGKEALKLLSEKTDNTGIAVYSWLCFYANSKAQDCFPSIPTLARHCNVSSRTIIRKLKRLEQLKVILIDRTEGRSNIYKLLDVTLSGKNAVERTSDTGVTGDMDDTGGVTPMSPPVVTPVSPEQYLIEQDLNNKTAGVNSLDSIFCGKLPYLPPDKELIREMVELCVEFLGEINLFKFIHHYAHDRGYPPHPTVMVKLCRQFRNDKVKITNVWGWFRHGVDAESAQFFANQNIAEHHQHARDPTNIGSILSRMASAG